MYNVGARHFLFLTVPPIERSPLVRDSLMCYPWLITAEDARTSCVSPLRRAGSDRGLQ